MNFKHWILLGLVVVSTLLIGQAVTAPGALAIAQSPLFARASLPPLNMLVMGKDHKIYYEAYNDASDLDGDGVPEVGYQGWQTKVVDGVTSYKIDYFGYFNSYACYSWDGTKFNPVSKTTTKTCTGQWSGDFLNYLTMSRMDALRRVLYGGWRQVDTATETVLQGAFFPQDAHSWGKEYQSVARDGYDISAYAPLSAPTAGNYHLFAVTTVTDNSAPLFRVMQNSPYRIWNWLSIEGPVAGNKCFTSGNSRVDCVSGSTTWSLVPAGTLTGLTISTWKKSGGSPGDRTAMNNMFTNYAIAGNLCGTGSVSNIDKTGSNNPFTGNGCGHDNYITRISGSINISTAGNYRFAVDGDDAVDVTIDGTPVASWYGGHGRDRSDSGLNSHSGTINLSAGTHTIEFRHEEGSGDDSWGLFWENSAGSNRRDDYAVRVSVCPDTEALRDGTCKAYPDGHFKPTGILHDYGESERMYFGLIMGSQQNNLEGGKLRRNVGNFKDEIVANTGQFRTDVNGIARSIDRLRMIGGAYNSGTNNLNNDSNWNWANGNGDCGGTGDAITNGNCRMWGNPIAEMMYESLRYFAGAATATTRFATGGSANGVNEETAMGLTTDTWKDPYKSQADGGLGYPTCAKPYQTVISDINPSYDGDLPGSAFADTTKTVNDTPASIAGFSATTEGNAIWSHEFNGPRNVFIGEVVGTATDDAPTAKAATSFANIRGLAPEEPTKAGTYYSASVARYGRITDINAATSPQNLSTYSIALASPLPRIEIPVGTAGQKITLVPFAKTVSGTFGGGTRKPTNTIVDFYIQELKNFPGQTVDMTINGGRAKAVFRINYEDVEQGNDHDMDTIARYEVNAKADDTVDVQVISEYAAGSANQYMGYVLSGSSNDGIYLEICDLRNGIGNPGNSTDKSLCASTDTVYRFNTPPGRSPGYCASGAPPADCAGLPPTSSVRNFSPGTSSITRLMDPLWYAAKYGGFNDANANGLPETTEWDADGDGTPDNYFLVTNPLNLRSQLTKAFDAIQQQSGTSGTIGLSGARVDLSSVAVIPSYTSFAGGHDWIGDLKAYNINANGVLGAERWSAATKLGAAPVSGRNIYTAFTNVDETNRTAAVKQFKASEWTGLTESEKFGRLGYTTAQIINLFGGSTTSEQMVNYLRGERGMEGTAKNVAPFRRRTNILGDIINSTPVISTKRANYGWAASTGLPAAQRTAYTTFVAGKSTRTEHAFVGANDGMLHAFDDDGDESFAYIPSGVLANMGLLADPEYQHRYYTDGNLTLSDAYVGGGWETLLVGAAGAGGRSVFGLNVSNPGAFDQNDVLWEVNSQTDPDMGYVMGKPVIVPTDSGRWVAIYGNGYNSQNYNPVLFIVDVATGEVIKKLEPVDGTTESNGLGNIAALDTDSDGLVDTVYGGDLQGNVWKFDIDGAETAWSVALGGAPLFTAVDGSGNRQPITGSFEIAVGPGAGYMLYFGTGRYFVNGDNSAAAGQPLQSLYGIWDNGTALSTGRSTLVAQQITASAGAAPATRTVTRNPVSYLANRGWYLDLVVGAATTATGERFISTPRIQSGKVYFPTYQPGFASDCVPGGKNWLYALDPLSGGAAFGQISLPPTGTVGDGDTGGVSTGDGAPSRGVGVTQPQPVTPIYCDPADAACVPPTTPPDTKCSEVIIDPADPTKPLVVQRACGRQSWRQLL